MSGERDLFVVTVPKGVSIETGHHVRTAVSEQLTESGVDRPIVLVVEDGIYISHERIEAASKNHVVKLQLDAQQAIAQMDAAARSYAARFA